MQLLDGKALAEQIKQEIKQKVEAQIAAGGKQPHLAAILVGQDGASQTYVNHKVKSCETVGFTSTLVRLDENSTEEELLHQVHALNQNDDVDGFIVQLPLPKHINEEKIILAIHPKKDVDGFHPVNFGNMALELPAYISATPLGILTLLDRYHIETSGKHCVVIGRSNIVGKPMSILMAQNHKVGNCTVTLCHSRTQNLAGICQTADIVIAAIGKPNFVTKDIIKPGAVVIDVGITRVEDKSKKSGFCLVGDVHFDEVADLCSYITPVPGGVGPMTVISLLLNTLKASNHEV